MVRIAQRNSAMSLRLVCLLICSTLTSSCLGGEQIDTVCVDGAAAVKQENYERAMNIWAENSVDASAKMRLRAVLDCMAPIGIAQNDELSAAWILARAEEGSVQAKLYVALLFASGVGVDADLETAAIWLAKAADNGSEAAAFLGEKLKSVSEELE